MYIHVNLEFIFKEPSYQHLVQLIDTVESFKFVGGGPIFEIFQILTGTWGRNFVDRLVGEKWRGGGGEGKKTPGKFYFFKKDFCFFKRL